MKAVATTRMSTKGQVVIPEELRKTYGWQPGTSFLVVGRGNAIVLQPLTIPDMSQFDDIVAKCRRAAKKAGMTPKDVRNTIKAVRNEKR